jgi:hypothetical protein
MQVSIRILFILSCAQLHNSMLINFSVCSVQSCGGGPRSQNGVSPTFHKRNLPGVETERSRPSARECREISQ